MNSQLIKELEEERCIKDFIKRLCQQGYNAKIIEFPIVSITQKQLGQGHNIPDAIVQIKGELHFCEVTSASRYGDMRERIGKMRKRLYVPSNQLQDSYNLGSLLDSTKAEFSKMLSQKFSKNYSEFMKRKQIEKGVLLIEGIFENPFFDQQEAIDLIKLLSDKVVLDQLGAGRSCFTEAYFCSYVQEPDGAWQMRYSCIADSAMFAFLKERTVRMDEAKKEYGLTITD